MQAEHLQVVADVADDRQLAGREDVVETRSELGAADPAGEENDVHAVRAARDFVLIQHKRRSPAEGKAEPLELLEIVERVDVVLELDDRGQAEACGGEAGSAAGAVGGREPGAIGQRERVRRPIRCRDVGGSELLEPRRAWPV